MDVSSLASSSEFEYRHSLVVRIRIDSETSSDVTVRGMDLKLGTSNSRSLSSRPRSSGGLAEIKFKCQGKTVSLWGGKALENQKANEWSVESPAGFLRVFGKPYRERIRIFSDSKSSGCCLVVNEVDLEHYLDGLVNAEFNSSWSREAIEAQVIAARTYALYQMREARRKNAQYDLESTTKDQVYDGSIREDDRASAAVDRTRGVVLTAVGSDRRVQPLKAFYHSTCGGQTTLPQNVWGVSMPGFIRKVACPYCTISPRYRWSFLVEPQVVRSKLENYSRQKLGKFHGVRLLKVDAEGRVAKSEWIFANQKLSLTGVQVRDLFGVQNLMSTRFEVKKEGETQDGLRFSFVGKGFGHGVGMCQWGARRMGDLGFSSEKILSFYYPEASLKKIW